MQTTNLIPSESTRFATYFRWIVFALALYYVVRMALFGGYGGFGGPLRYLTNWALVFSFISATMMILRSTGRISFRPEAWVAMTAVLNAMVVFLYWRLYFADPNSVTENGELLPWWLEYYLHLVGPLLQWIDALFIFNGFRRFWPALGLTVVMVLAYIGWSELVVGPTNPEPIGTVTTGLPYPFLNNLQPAERMQFYGVNLVVSAVFLGGFTLMAWGIRRLFFRKQAA